jgi:hypothetical protein
MIINNYRELYTIDDFIPIYYQNILEKFFLGDYLNWEEQKNISNIGNSERVGYHSLIGSMTTDFFYPENQAYQFTLPVALLAFQSVGIEISNVAMLRAFKTEPLYSDPEPVHVDIDIDHWVCLYYPHNVDGETIFMKEKFPDVSLEQSSSYNFTEYMRVKPKKGRAVVFRGNRYHSSYRSKDKTRIVVNCDAFVKL